MDKLDDGVETAPILQVLFSVRLDDYEEELNALDKSYYNFLKDKLFEVLVARKLIQAWDVDLNEPNLQWYIDDSSSPGVKCAPHYRKLMFTSIINIDYKELEENWEDVENDFANAVKRRSLIGDKDREDEGYGSFGSRNLLISVDLGPGPTLVGLETPTSSFELLMQGKTVHGPDNQMIIMEHFHQSQNSAQNDDVQTSHQQLNEQDNALAGSCTSFAGASQTSLDQGHEQLHTGQINDDLNNNVQTSDNN